MSHIAPIERRLHLGLAAPVTAEEVGELLGIGDDERDRLLERVPPLARGARGGLRYRWGRVLDVLEAKAPPEAPKPANRLPLADVAPRRGLRAPRPVHRGAQVEHGWPAVAVLLWWATGARIGEIGALRVGDLRLDASAAVLLGRHRGARKTGARWVELDETVAATVAAYLEARGPLGVTDPLWPVRAEYVRSSLWREHVRPILVREGIPDFTAHAGRAAVIDTLYELGEDPRLVADLLGHSVATAIAYYRRSRPPRQRAAMLARGVGATTTAPETPDNVVPLRSRP